jgi:hypothetical protein
VSKDPLGPRLSSNGDDASKGGRAEARPSENAPSEDDVHATEDATLGGYLRVHERPPAFEGSDGQPYSVSIEIERTPNLVRPFIGYLVFPRWAETGVGIVGHVETPVLWEGTTRAEVADLAGETPLLRVKEHLDRAIEAKADADRTSSPG